MSKEDTMAATLSLFTNTNPTKEVVPMVTTEILHYISVTTDGIWALPDTVNPEVVRPEWSDHARIDYSPSKSVRTIRPINTRDRIQAARDYEAKYVSRYRAKEAKRQEALVYLGVAQGKFAVPVRVIRPRGIVAAHNRIQNAMWRARLFQTYSFDPREGTSDVDFNEEDAFNEEMNTIDIEALARKLVKVAVHKAKLNRRARQKARRECKVAKVRLSRTNKSRLVLPKKAKPAHINIRRTNTRHIRRVLRWMEFIEKRNQEAYLNYLRATNVMLVNVHGVMEEVK